MKFSFCCRPCCEASCAVSDNGEGGQITRDNRDIYTTCDYQSDSRATSRGDARFSPVVPSERLYKQRPSVADKRRQLRERNKVRNERLSERLVGQDSSIGRWDKVSANGERRKLDGRWNRTSSPSWSRYLRDRIIVSLLLRLAKHSKSKIERVWTIELCTSEEERRRRSSPLNRGRDISEETLKRTRYTGQWRSKERSTFLSTDFDRRSLDYRARRLEILLKRAASAVHLFSLYPASLNSLFRNPHAPFPRRRADARASMPQRTPRRSTQRRRG